MIKNRWSGTGQFAIAMNKITEFQIDGGAQCFPLYLYDETDKKNDAQLSMIPSLEDKTKNGDYQRRDAITDVAYSHFQKNYLSR